MSKVNAAHAQWLEEVSAIDRTDILERHEITAHQRAKMVDWMIEVMSSFNQEDKTFFLAVSTMDRYFENSATAKEVHELHLIGVTAMYLASKAEDSSPLDLETVHESIVHKKFSTE